MRLALVILVILLVPAVSGNTVTFEDPADDQHLAPSFKAFDVAALVLNGLAEEKEGHGAGLVWGISFHDGPAMHARPHPDLDDVVAYARLGANDTEDPYRHMCLSMPPACFGGTLHHDSFGPGACVFEGIAVELWHEGELIDRVPDEGNLTYDACWVFASDDADRNTTGDPPSPAQPSGNKTERDPAGEAGTDGSGPERSTGLPVWLVAAALFLALRGPSSRRGPGRATSPAGSQAAHSEPFGL